MKSVILQWFVDTSTDKTAVTEVCYSLVMPADSQPSASQAIALPAHWGRKQRVKNTGIYYALRCLAGLLKAIPFVLLPGCAWCLGTIGYFLAGRERTRSQQQMQQALPHLNSRQIRRHVHGMFVHLAYSILELWHQKRLLGSKRYIEFLPEDQKLLDETLALGRGAVIAGGHIGNWELLAQTLAHAGYPIAAIAKPLYDPRLTRWVAQERGHQGLKILWRGDRQNAKAMLRLFRQRGLLALLVDQDTRVDGIFAPFFGRMAFTPTAPATLGLRFKAPLLFFWMHRQGRQHRLRVRRLELNSDADPQSEIARVTYRINAELEAVIRQKPSQWVWLHARWKQRIQHFAP